MSCSTTTKVTTFEIMPQTDFREQYAAHSSEISANKHNPLRFYRYRSCETPHFREELERLVKRNQVYCPSQIQLNDPFDCQPVCERGVTFNEYHRLLHPVVCAIRTEMARELSPIYFSPDQMQLMINENAASEDLSVIREAYEVKLDKMISDMFKTLGILSLTTDNNNLVMWSMDASRGNGICIEFEGLRFPVGLNEIVPAQVLYQTVRPKFDYVGAVALFLHMTINAAQYVPRVSRHRLLKGLQQAQYAWTKHARWSYEEEYRIIKYKSGGEYLTIDPARASKLYIGDRVPLEMREWIMSLVKDKPIGIYLASLSDTGFSMTFQSL